MNKEFQEYINKIVGLIGVSGKKKKQISEDLYAALEEKQQETGESNPYILMGDAEEVAEEFRENLGIDNENSISRFYDRHRYGFEYVSKTKVFGVPLVHINTKPLGIAKGIFSYGTVAIGVFSFGAAAIGIFSFGAIGLGLILAAGGAAVSGLASFGGAAAAYGLSCGGAAVAKVIAVGGYAKANIAIGGYADGIVAVFNQHGAGQYMFKMPADKDQVIIAVKRVYPNISKIFLDALRFFI